jgi:membrane protease YdiL (CAAX protease family)
VPLYAWDVRLFEPGSPREALVRLGADGRLVGVRRTLAESDRRPTVSEAAGRGAAEAALARVSGVPVTTAPAGAGWRFVAASFETQPRSGRVDRTYRFERVGVRVGGAPVRADVTVTGRATRAAVAGAVPTDSAATDASAAELLAVRTYAEVPESWRRRYDEMRASNDLYASLALPGLLAFAAAAVIALAGARRAGHVVRWRPAVLVGALVGAFLLAATLNGLPLAWFDYDTATAPRTFVLQQLLGALAAGVATVVFVTLTVAAAQLLTRRAFPWQVDWFAFVRRREHPAVGAQVLGGYALAAFGFAYVTLFYLGARRILGWWVPTGSLDDPNLVATPLPWAGAIGMALFAGVWEEAVFRAVPLAALSLWVGDRPGRRWWMGAGVVATALVFGFGHANYPSWPAYSRGVELFLEAALWAVLYLRVGLPVTIVAHVLYDLVWFGLFAAHGEGTAYRTTLAVVVAAGALPALLVAHGAWRRRALRRQGGAIAPAPRLGDRTPAPLPSSGAIAAAPTITP